MTGIDSPSSASDNMIVKLWRWIPFPIRVILSGLFVFMIVGLGVWMVVLALVPIPWSLVVMVVALWAYWKYVSGSWGTKSSAKIRAEKFRRTRLAKKVWLWSIIAGLLIVAIIQSGLVITFRILEFPKDAWVTQLNIEDYPMWMVWAYVVLTASVAGITEEVGFRGYMQVPLEKRYGPTVGIIIVSVMFMVTHLNQAWAPPVLIHLFTFSVLWGVLAYISGSIILGIISHTVLDVFNFSYWWTGIAGKYNQPLIAETGIDAHFIIWLVVLIVSTVLFVWAIRKTKVIRQKSEQENEILERS